ncbi:uncharacterized protein LOC111259178 isoform X3 [Varroa jacobsoni]|uniref:LIM zinc-binding domain-containing protein n=1 Tax=Varroa destructor TaxID=109461 RepID=A0A7M7JTK9_VARDE|nr:uncharacterized protein LOC111246034 isoform X3 [Varroa destructor]XP_022686689.1 uncharacterized protein LOC111259178 isoform X3 [Varroa jacobsoni]
MWWYFGWLVFIYVLLCVWRDVRALLDISTVPSAGESSASVASPVSLSAERDIHLHCENCINVGTCHDSTCPIVPCDCGHKLHECKLEDHALLCREADFKVRGALSGRANGSRWIQRSATHVRNPSSAVPPALRKHPELSSLSPNRMASPSQLDAGSASQRSPNQDYLPTSTPPTSPLESSPPSQTNSNSGAGKRFLLDDVEMNVLETLAKENPDLLTHGVNLDIEETITCSPEDDTPPGLHESDMMSPSSEQTGSGLNSERNSVPNVEIFVVADSAESKRRTDSLVELGENIVAEAVQLAKSTVEDMLLRTQEEKLAAAQQHMNKGDVNNQAETVTPDKARISPNSGDNGETMINKAEEQKQTSELLDSLMKTPRPAARTSLAGEDADSLSEEPDNNEPDSEQMLDDASLSLHGHEEPETVSEESSSCLEPVRVQGAKSPTLEDIPDLPDDQEKKAKLRSKARKDVIEEVIDEDDDDDDESQNSDTESHSPSPLDNYRRSRTVVRKVKKVEATVIHSESTMTTGKQEKLQSSATSSNQTTRIIRRNENPNKIVNTTCRSQQLLPSFVKPIPRLSLPQKQSYVQNAVENRICNGHGSMPLSPERALRSRENIPSISIECLKNAYDSLAQAKQGGDSATLSKPTSCPDDLVPVNINALRESLTRQTSIHAAREASPIEDVKLSVDKKKLQNQFSVESGDVDGKCKRCQGTVYPAECVRAEKAQYHKKCFTCKECKKSLSAESYHSHESELYCANHFKQLFQPKANFDRTVTPNGQEMSSGCISVDDGKQREPIIRENEPAQLPPDVVRCGTGSTMEDLEGLNLNLASIKSQFEKKDKADINAKGQPAVDRSASSRSDVLRKRLERYQSVVAGEAKAESSDEEGGDDQADSSKKIEPCREIGELKAQWESGRVNNDNGFATADAESLHEKICPGLSKTKVAYEKAIKESHTKENKTSPPEDVSVGHALANSLKKKFESGEVAKEEEAERLEAVKSEKEEDLSVCQDPVIAQQAKLLFQKIDKEIAARPTAPPTTSLVRTPSDSRWSRASFGEAPKDIEVVHGSEPGYKEQVEVETAALSERYRFFENFKEEAASVKKKFQMTPPRELEPRNRDASPPPVCERDPNVVVGSITTTDIPNVDTATKMRQKFETLCQTGGLQEPPVKTCQVPKPRPLKKPSLDASPPQVTATSSAHVIEEDCMPADNITRNMRAVFERNNVADKNNGSGQLSSPASTERVNPPKVSRFVFGTPETEVCSMCQGKVFPMERREASGLVMHTKCFKCTRCNINLRLDGYSQKGGKLYCEAHYQQLFKVKGNYDEGFGCEKWSRTPSPSAHDAPPTSLNLPPAASNQTLIA